MLQNFVITVKSIDCVVVRVVNQKIECVFSVYLLIELNRIFSSDHIPSMSNPIHFSLHICWVSCIESDIFIHSFLHCSLLGFHWFFPFFLIVRDFVSGFFFLFFFISSSISCSFFFVLFQNFRHDRCIFGSYHQSNNFRPGHPNVGFVNEAICICTCVRRDEFEMLVLQ